MRPCFDEKKIIVYLTTIGSDLGKLYVLNFYVCFEVGRKVWLEREDVSENISPPGWFKTR